MLSNQADIEIVDVLKMVGAEVTVTDDCIEVGEGDLKAFNFDATHCPDLFPPLAALAANCDGVSRIAGVERLIHKESNRSAALQKEFSTLGGGISVKGNTMEILGGKLKGGTVDSHGDHRIAMAAAVAALNADGPVHIDGAECVEKSYPNFYQDFSQLQTK